MIAVAAAAAAAVAVAVAVTVFEIRKINVIRLEENADESSRAVNLCIKTKIETAIMLFYPQLFKNPFCLWHVLSLILPFNLLGEFGNF